MKYTYAISCLIASCTSFGQIPHEFPDHPKGNNSNDQYEALPLYNEACELYEKGQVQRAKKALKESINISFALTESQLFLASIFYEEHKMDSAFLYFNSGIDFVVEQYPRYYFYLFETGLMMEEYGVVKHNLKHFNKLYGKIAAGKYEDEYPFTVDDYERYLNASQLTYDYTNWVPKSYIKDSLNLKGFKGIAPVKNNLLAFTSERGSILRQAKGFKNRKKYKHTFEGVEKVNISKSGELMFLSKADGDDVNIYYLIKKGSRWGEPIKLSEMINTKGWNSDPFYVEEHSLLYFSSDKSGNKDLYVAKLDLATRECISVQALDRVNTIYDEISPVFVDDKFYFSSNGLPGFGGFDLYTTPHYTLMDGVITPSDWLNMGKPYNSGMNETGIHFFANSNHIVCRESYENDKWFILMNFLADQKKFNYDIKIIEFPADIE